MCKRNWSACPSNSSSDDRRKVPDDIRFDDFRHFSLKSSTTRKCAMCTKNAKRWCPNCGKALHDHCFNRFHGYEYMGHTEWAAILKQANFCSQKLFLAFHFYDLICYIKLHFAFLFPLANFVFMFTSLTSYLNRTLVKLNTIFNFYEIFYVLSHSTGPEKLWNNNWKTQIELHLP